MLTMAEALNRLEDGNFHNVAYVSFDAKRKSAGKIIRIDDCRLPERKEWIRDKKKSNTTAQNHSDNATRNLILKSNQTRKMHIHSLFMVDSIKVI